MTTYTVLRLNLNTTSNKFVIKYLNAYWRKLFDVIDFEDSDIDIQDFTGNDYNTLKNVNFYSAEDFVFANYICLKSPYKLVMDDNHNYYFEYILCSTDYDSVIDAFADLSIIEDAKTVLNALKYLNDLDGEIVLVTYNDFGLEYICSKE